MKQFTLISTALAICFSLTAYAGAPATAGCEDEKNLFQEVATLVNDEAAANEMDLKGTAEMTFTIDENGRLHIEQIMTKDYLFEYHIRQKLEGTQVSYCLEKGAKYTIVLNAKRA